MIRIATVDDHPALSAGVTTVLQREPDFVPVGTASTKNEIAPLVYRTAPDIVLLDYHLPGTDGLRVCRSLKDVPAGPRVVIYTAYAGAPLAVGARAAGADGLASKAAPARELFEMLRRVHAGEQMLPAITPQDIADACARVEPEDQPLLTVLLDGATGAEVADALRVPGDEVRWRVERVLSRLRVEVPSASLR